MQSSWRTIVTCTPTKHHRFASQVEQSAVNYYRNYMVPVAGVEPAIPRRSCIDSAVRLPFRHTGLGITEGATSGIIWTESLARP